MILIICHQSLKSRKPFTRWTLIEHQEKWNPSWAVQSCRSRSKWCLHNILSHIWEQEKMPEDFWDALNVTLYKNKGSKANCGNYGGISLISITGKILAWVILNWLIIMSEANLPEAQCGFWPGCSTVNMTVSVGQFQEKCIEQNLNLYSVFINLTKIFDTVNREALWSKLAWYDCPQKFIKIIRHFHVGMTGQVLSNNVQSDPFKISNGVKQGWRFCIQPSLTDSKVKDNDLSHPGCTVYWCLHTHATQVQWSEIMLNRFSDASKLLGLTISLGKNEVLFQPAPNIHTYTPQHVPDHKAESLKVLLSSHPCSMAMSPGLSTIITSGCWRSSIYKHSIPSWVSNGRTKSPIY